MLKLGSWYYNESRMLPINCKNPSETNADLYEYFDSKAVHSAISDTPAETPKRKKKGKYIIFNIIVVYINEFTSIRSNCGNSSSSQEA